MEKACRQLRYPIGIQTFEKIITGGYVYVDKTRFIHELTLGGKYLFLSRPRRFGKSLLLSTLEAYYSGRRDLFKGLALDSLTDDWDPHPILHIDLNTGDYSSHDALISVINRHLEIWEAAYGDEKKNRSVEERFGYIIMRACEKTGRKVVILIDEYDKPMLSAIDDEPLADRFRNTLKAFYSNLKTMDRYIELAFLTGVARFSKVSIFSDLNNLRDISFEPGFSAICGITDEEIDTYFREGVRCVAESNGQTYEETRRELRRRYDGYHFSKKLVDIYNPFSLLNVFASNDFSNYWFQSGTPTYVVKLLKNKDWRLKEVEGYRIKATRLSSEGIMTKDPIPALFQSGYVTISGYNPAFDQFTLDYPNLEVEQSFIDFLMPLYLGEDSLRNEFDVSNFVTDVLEGRPADFMTRLDSLLRGVPHIGTGDPHENLFQNSIYIVFKMVGFYTKMEDHTSNGRIDLTVETGNYIYVFEFKTDKTAGEGMAQILQKEYWKKYEASGKNIFLVAASFDRRKRTLADISITTPPKV